MGKWRNEVRILEFRARLQPTCSLLLHLPPLVVAAVLHEPFYVTGIGDPPLITKQLTNTVRWMVPVLKRAGLGKMLSYRIEANLEDYLLISEDTLPLKMCQRIRRELARFLPSLPCLEEVETETETETKTETEGQLAENLEDQHRRSVRNIAEINLPVYPSSLKKSLNLQAVFEADPAESFLKESFLFPFSYDFFIMFGEYDLPPRLLREHASMDTLVLILLLTGSWISGKKIFIYFQCALFTRDEHLQTFLIMWLLGKVPELSGKLSVFHEFLKIKNSIWLASSIAKEDPLRQLWSLVPPFQRTVLSVPGKDACGLQHQFLRILALNGKLDLLDQFPFDEASPMLLKDIAEKEEDLLLQLILDLPIISEPIRDSTAILAYSFISTPEFSNSPCPLLYQLRRLDYPERKEILRRFDRRIAYHIPTNLLLAGIEEDLDKLAALLDEVPEIRRVASYGALVPTPDQMSQVSPQLLFALAYLRLGPEIALRRYKRRMQQRRIYWNLMRKLNLFEPEDLLFLLEGCSFEDHHGLGEVEEERVVNSRKIELAYELTRFAAGLPPFYQRAHDEDTPLMFLATLHENRVNLPRLLRNNRDPSSWHQTLLDYVGTFHPSRLVYGLGYGEHNYLIFNDRVRRVQIQDMTQSEDQMAAPVGLEEWETILPLLLRDNEIPLEILASVEEILLARERMDRNRLEGEAGTTLPVFSKPLRNVLSREDLAGFQQAIWGMMGWDVLWFTMVSLVREGYLRLPEARPEGSRKLTRKTWGNLERFFTIMGNLPNLEERMYLGSRIYWSRPGFFVSLEVLDFLAQSLYSR